MKTQDVLIFTLLFSALLGGCQSVPQDSKPLSMQERISSLQVVDCLLPGQVRMVGAQAYQTSRRPTKTTASDCSIRGGEFVA